MRETQPEQPGLGELIHRVVEDGKGYASAEFDYYRTLARAKFAQVRGGLILLVVALFLLHAAALALIFGLVLSIASLVGPGWATLILVLAFLAGAGLAGWIAAGKIKRAFGSKA